MEMKVLVLLLSVCILGSEGTNPCVSANGTEWNRYNGHWYYYSAEKMNWIGSQLHCRRLGGHLVHIDDDQENDWLSSKYTEESIWIGALDLAEEGVWRSITTGEKVQYTKWAENNPNNFNSVDQDCASLNWDRNGLWDDNVCSKEFPFICEVVG